MQQDLGGNDSELNKHSNFLTYIENMGEARNMAAGFSIYKGRYP